MYEYDICVDYDVLCDIEDKLDKIEHDVEASTEKMVGAINRSQDFLAGHQFEKAKNTTMKCTEITRKTQINIKFAKDYISKLRGLIEDYSRGAYPEVSK